MDLKLLLLLYLQTKNNNVQDKLYPTYNTFNYIHSYTFCVATEALNSLKSTGQTTVVLGIWSVMIVMAVEDSVICHYEEC